MTRTIVHVIAVGDFGVALADRLAGALGATMVVDQVDQARADTAGWPDAELRVLAAWRPVPALADGVDEHAHRRGTPWLTAVLEHPYVRVGPLVVPGAGPCHACFGHRSLQHDPAPHLVRGLRGLYDAQPGHGPWGHLPHHVEMTAALVLRAQHGLRADPASEAGTVRRHHLLEGLVSSDRVTGVHGCRRCGQGRDEATRSTAVLGSDVAAWHERTGAAWPR